MPLRHWSTGNDGVAKRPMPSMGLAMPSLPWTRASGWRRRDFIALSHCLVRAMRGRLKMLMLCVRVFGKVTKIVRGLMGKLPRRSEQFFSTWYFVPGLREVKIVQISAIIYKFAFCQICKVSSDPRFGRFLKKNTRILYQFNFTGKLLSVCGDTLMSLIN